MLWRGIELSTFDVETLEGWIAKLLDEIADIQAEIDRRVVTGMDPLLRATDHGPGQGSSGHGPTDTISRFKTEPTGGHPPAGTKREGKESLPGE